MANELHNIICFETEWEYRYDKCHGKHHAITLEDEDGDINLSELKTMANGFFVSIL